MREEFAEVLQEVADDGLTKCEHIIRTLIQMAMEGNVKPLSTSLTAWADGLSNPSR
jgi:hypothetical protein